MYTVEHVLQMMDDAIHVVMDDDVLRESLEMYDIDVADYTQDYRDGFVQALRWVREYVECIGKE